MHIDWPRVLPVIVSIGIIIAIAVLRQYSRTFAAIAAVMPINIPLGMWIVVSGETGESAQAALADFSRALLVNIIPTLLFMAAAWWLTREGYGLLPTIIGGYVVWGLGLLAIFWLRGQLGG